MRLSKLSHFEVKLATTDVAMNLRSRRTEFGISQSRLARLTGVSRFKICTYEPGDTSLSNDEQIRIREALRTEAECHRNIPTQLGFGQHKNITTSGADHD